MKIKKNLILFAVLILVITSVTACGNQVNEEKVERTSVENKEAESDSVEELVDVEEENVGVSAEESVNESAKEEEDNEEVIVIDADTLAEYGLMELDLGYPLSEVFENGNYTIVRINGVSFEETKALGKKFAAVVTLYGWDGKESDGTSLMREDDPVPMDMFYYQVGDKWVNLNIAYLTDKAEFQFGYNTPSFAN